MTDEKAPRPFRSCVTDYEAIRKRRDELVPGPFENVDIAKQPMAPAHIDYNDCCG